MSTIMTANSRRRGQDHFEPEGIDDPHEQRRMRGYLEQIDFTSFAANKTVIGQTLGSIDIARFQRLAVLASQARLRWIQAGISLSDSGPSPSPEQVSQLTELRQAYEELAEAYEGLRRLVERGYLPFHGKA